MARARRRLEQDLKPFSPYLALERAETCDVPSGPREARNEARTDGIRDYNKHNRNRQGRLFNCGESRRAVDNDDIWRVTYELFCLGFRFLRMIAKPLHLDPGIRPVSRS